MAMLKKTARILGVLCATAGTFGSLGGPLVALVSEAVRGTVSGTRDFWDENPPFFGGASKSGLEVPSPRKWLDVRIKV